MYVYILNRLDLRWRYTIDVPILMCPNINFVLMYYILVNKVSNDLLQFTIHLAKNKHI